MAIFTASTCIAFMPLQATSPSKVASLPDSGIVLSNILRGGTAVTDRTNPNQYEAAGQVIESGALDGDEIGIDRAFLEVSIGTTIPGSGTHAIDFWVGEWNRDDNTPGAQVIRETFNVLGLTFEDGEIYEFAFSNPFSLDQSKDYAFQVWWTTDDPSHEISWVRDTGQGFIGGGFISEKDSGLALPFDATPSNNTDLWFAFGSVPEPSSSGLLMMGILAGIRFRNRTGITR